MRFTCLGDPPQPRLASRTVLPWHQADSRTELSATPEVALVAHHRHPRRDRHLADALQPHRMLRLATLPGHLGDVPVVGLDALVQAVHFTAQPLPPLTAFTRPGKSSSNAASCVRTVAAFSGNTMPTSLSPPPGFG